MAPSHPSRPSGARVHAHGLQSGHFFLNLAMLSSSASYAFSLSTISCHVPVQRSWYWIFSGTSGQRSRCSVARSIAWAVCSTYATDLLLFHFRNRISICRKKIYAPLRTLELFCEKHPTQYLADKGLGKLFS